MLFAMGGVERLGNFGGKDDEHLEGKRTLRDELFQSGAFEKFHSDEGLAIFLAYVINGADIGMVQRRSGLRFALESSERAGVVADIFGKEFQCDVAAEAIVFGFVDDTHPAASKALQNAIVRESLAQ